ncbi:MAG: SDR family oxidoreductase [Salinivirgaceae bacterium]|jgi:short-subunit dehydrogenase
MKDFANKVVIITGASSGIGSALAFEFNKLGACLSLTARRIDRLELLKEQLEKSGGKVLVTYTDITDETHCCQLIDRTLEHFGSIDILINNAGISMRAMFADTELFVLKKLMDVNFWGTVYCTKYALPHLLKAKGVVVGVSSIAGFHGLPGRSGYSASKFAMHGFLETLRIEHLKSGLHVMVIAPGFTASEIRENALLSDGSMQGETPREEEKLMSPERVAKILIRSIRRRKRNKIVTFSGQIIALFQRIIPEQIDWLIYKNMANEPNSPFK